MSKVSLLPNAAATAGQAPEDLLPLVYGELRRLAAHKLEGEAAGQTLQPTALVHEAWLRLSQEAGSKWKNRDHFYAIAAEVMRRLLVDRARRRLSGRHGGHLERVEMDAVELPDPQDDSVVLDLHDALERFSEVDQQKAEIVKLRYFVGLGNEDIAGLLGLSTKTIERHWAFAKAWLGRAMKHRAPPGSAPN